MTVDIFKWEDPTQWSAIFSKCLLKAKWYRDHGNVAMADHYHSLAAAALERKKIAIEKFERRQGRRKKRRD